MWQRGGPDMADVLQVSWTALRYGGNSSPWGAPGCRCLALWPWDTVWAGDSAMPTLALGWCRDLLAMWEEKAAGLKSGVVVAFCAPACLDRRQACPWIPVVMICPAFCLSLKQKKKVIIAYVLVASSVGERKACCVWHVCSKETVWTDVC